jgi:filamentous hemagglutinin family protein
MKYTTWISLFPLATLGCLIPLSTQAQVTPDGTTSTTVNQNGNNFTIEQGDRVGDNLFHSFNEFSVPTLGSAAFNNAGDIANIFSRVTGSSISSIDGLLSANGAANLFLINPNGIIFGENASLNLGGSFFASTADSLLFEGNTEFSASNPQAPPLLEVSIPIGARFRNEPGDIVHKSRFSFDNINISIGLFIQPEENITFLGGEIRFDGGIISAPGSRVQLGGISEAGIVSLNEDGSLSFPDNLNRENIVFVNEALVDTTNNRAGEIHLQGRRIFLTDESNIFSLNRGSQSGGKITIDATESVDLIGSGFRSNTGLFNSASAGIAGDIEITTKNLTVQNSAQISAFAINEGQAGNIIINAAESIELLGDEAGKQPGNIAGATFLTGGGLLAQAIGSGKAGNIELTTENLILKDKTAISVDSLDTGVAGNVNIQAENLSIQTGSNISASTFGLADGGNITINAQQIEIDGVSEDGQAESSITAQTGGFLFENINPEEVLAFTGKAGDISIDTETLTLNNGARVRTSTFNAGLAGNLNIQASETVEIIGSGFSQNDLISSGLFADIENGSSGNAGNLTIETRNLIVKDGAQIGAGNRGNGQGGILEITALDSIELVGTLDENTSSGLFTSSTSNGSAGNLTLETEELTIADGASVTVSSPQGQAGNLNITANSLFQNQGLITAETGLSEGDIGANINLEISDLWRMENESLVSATALGDADGGNININFDRNNPNLSNTELILLAFPPTGIRGSDIAANAERGTGGEINIRAAGIFGIENRQIPPEQARSNSLNDFTDTSESGQPGETIINRTVDDPTSGLINLPASVGDASDQISQNPCEQGVGSEFIITGKGGLPPSVNESLNSESAQVGLIEAVPSQQQTVGANGIRPNPKDIHPNLAATSEAVPAQGWVFNDKGEVTLTAYKTTNTGRQSFPKTPMNSCSAKPDKI